MATSSNEIYDKFNPKVPEVEGGNYLGISKPVEAPKLLGGKGLGDVGNIISGAIQATDEVIKADIRDDAAQRAQPIVDQYTKDLESIRNSIYGNSQVGPHTASFVEQSLAGNTTFDKDAIPAGLKGIAPKLTMLANARANGTISDTYMTAAQDEFIRSARSRVPEGYRHYVSQVASQVLNEPIANEYRASLTKDINAVMGRAQKEREHMFNEIIKAATQDDSGKMNLVMEGVRKNIIDIQQGFNEATKVLAKGHALDIKLKEASLADKSVEQKRRDTAEAAETALSRHSTDYYNTLYSTFGFKDADAMTSYFKNNYDSDKAQQMANTAQTMALSTEQKMLDEINRPRKEFDGKSIAQILPPGEARKMVTNHLEGPRNFLAGLVNKDAGAVHAAKNWMTNTDAAYQAALLNTSDVGPQLRMYKAIRDRIGDQAMTWVNTEIGGTSAAIKGYIWHNNVLSVSGAVNPATGKPYRAMEEVEFLQQRGQATPEAVKGIIDSARNIILESQDPAAKRTQIERLFSPENYKLLSRMDESKQSILFGQLTDPKLMETIRATGEQHWNIYRNFVNSTANNTLIIPAIQTLNELADTAERPLYFKKGEGKNPPQFLTDSMDPIYGLDRVNMALKPLTEIANVEKGDINGRLYILLKHLGASKRVLAAINNSIAPEPTPAVP